LMPGDSSFRIISFGTFEVNLHTGELRQRGQKVKLQEQPFQVLAALLERPGELVTREELRSKLWPSDTFVDFDHGLNAAIKRLRDALGESADAPVFIETMARRGYRFIAPVDGGSTASGIETSAQERPKSTVVGKWIAVALLSSAVIAVLAWVRWRHSWRSSEMTERKLTTNSSENSVTSAAVSRDGKYLAYTDSTGIYLKLISTGETHPLPLPPNFPAHVDDWFQDGSHLLVTRGELSLWSISLFGGSPRLLADDARAGSVSPDGSHIAFQRRDYGREEWVMRADGTDQLKVAADKSSWVGRPTWSPDGNRIAYIRDSSTYNAREASVEVNDWRKSNAQTLFSDNRLSPSVYWLPNDLLVYAIGDEENQQRAGLRTVSPQQTGKSAGSSKSITPRGIGWINQLTGSADGKILTFTRENSVVSAYIGALAPDGTHLLSNKRMTFDENKNEPFAWTPDSKAILFNSNRNGTSEIFRQATDEPLAESMMASAEQLQQPRVTPDGSEILFISTPKSATPDTPNSIVAIPISGGPPRVVLQDANIWNIQCASPPSALCLYSVSKGDTSETFRFDVKTGKTSGAPQVDPWCNWSLSPDGSRRAVVSCRKRNGVIRLRSALTGETHELVVKGWDELDSIVWSADGKTLFATWSHESETALLRVALDGTVSVLLRSSNPQIVGAVPSPDGRSLAIAEQTTARNVWQIENF
jgi:DNA-binding winged helix-turn-helix (wHTH) protein/Tol biopolymer transport system component